MSDRKKQSDLYEYYSAIKGTDADPCSIDQPSDRLRETVPMLDSETAAAVMVWFATEVATHDTSELWFDRLRQVISAIATSRHPRLCAAGIAYAAGLAFVNGLPMADYARTINLSRAAVSKEAKLWSRRLKLYPSRYQRGARTKQHSVERDGKPTHKQAAL